MPMPRPAVLPVGWIWGLNPTHASGYDSCSRPRLRGLRLFRARGPRGGAACGATGDALRLRGRARGAAQSAQHALPRNRSGLTAWHEQQQSDD
jgi:hypothetical protein